MKRIKVLHIITRLDKGGSSENTLLTVKNLDNERYESSILYGMTKNPDEKYLPSVKKNIEVFFNIEDLVREINPLKDVKAFFKIYSFISKNNYHIVHTHSSKAGILGRWAAKFTGVPVIVHTPHGHIFYGYYGKIISWIFIFIERITASITDNLICLTERGKKEHISFKVGDEKKISVIHSGVDVDSIKNYAQKNERPFVKKNRIPPNSFVVGSMGRFVKVKGFEYFIKAAKIVSSKIDNAYFMLAGEGELEKSLKKLVLEYGLEKKFFFIPWQSDCRAFLYSLDLYVLSSVNEGMGKVIVEAMAAGLPVIGTDVGGVREIIEDGLTGFVIPPEDERSIAEKIEQLFFNKELRNRMGLMGQKRADSFSVKRMVEKIENLYRKLLKEKGLVNE
ncbi:MAG: glycosyltransferase family 1 protein [Candidatus Schekmanbacteria bacterium]|nr:MAG: glycosyltransferase family 1 protein [Candidatus Schekmanbacteria bacterium]